MSFAQRVGTEFLVNTATLHGQYASSVTALTGGGFVVTWEDHSSGVGGAPGDDSAVAIKAQIHDASGARVGSEFLVNTLTDGFQEKPSIAALANGGFVITWQSYFGAIGGADIAVKAQLYDANGVRQGGEFLVDTATYSSQYDPSVAALADGGFVIAWADNSAGVGGAPGDESGAAIKAQLYDAGGARVGGEFLVNTVVQDYQQAPEVTGLAHGGFVVTWRDDSGVDDDSGLGVKAQVYDAAGAKVGGERLVNTATVGHQYDNAVAALVGGGFVVAWTDTSGGVGGAGGDSSGEAVKAQLYDATGAPIGGEFLVNTTTQYSQVLPSVAALADGGFIVSWSEYGDDAGGASGDGSGFAIKAQVYDANGVRQGAEFLVNTATEGDQLDSALTGLAHGGFAATWSDYGGDGNALAGDGSGSAIKAQVFDVIGTLVGSVSDDILSGTAGSDAIAGAAGDDELHGRAGDDRLSGNGGDDVLIGGAGQDTLQGGAGRDAFRFDEIYAIHDRIKDFTLGEDRIELDGLAFEAIVDQIGGALSTVSFVLGTKARSPNHHVIYNQAKGQLLYDADGVGGEAAVLIATLGTKPDLHAEDIFVI